MTINENGTIEVVLCDRDSKGNLISNEMTQFKTFGGIRAGGGEWLSRKILRHVCRGTKKVQQGDKEDRFFGHGDYAPDPE